MVRHNLLIVGSNAVVGRETEFDAWYQQHLVESVQSFPGFQSGQRYQLVENLAAPFGFRHLAVYTIAADSLHDAQDAVAAVRAERAAAEREGRTPAHAASPAMAEPHFGWFFESIGEQALR